MPSMRTERNSWVPVLDHLQSAHDASVEVWTEFGMTSLVRSRAAGETPGRRWSSLLGSDDARRLVVMNADAPIHRAREHRVVGDRVSRREHQVQAVCPRAVETFDRLKH